MLGTQLYASTTDQISPATTVVMVEDAAICTRRPYHQQKLALLLAAMRNHASSLETQGVTVDYYALEEGHNLLSGLLTTLQTKAQTAFATYYINDSTLRRQIGQFAQTHNFDWIELEDPGFLTTHEAFKLFADKRAVRMDSFYKWQRKRLNILIEDGAPVGGKWSFDEDNRKKIPARQSVPPIPEVVQTDITQNTVDFVSKRFADHPGRASELWLPADRAGAESWLQSFIQERFVGFGTFEDALSGRTDLLFHSGLSPLMNLGLITPNEVLDAVLSVKHAPLNDLEGFVRQLIGWREFVRGVYLERDPSPKLANQRAHGRRLTTAWFDGTTGLPPLDRTIQTLLRRGWNHHIERLMVLANLMNLCEIHPDEVYEYFMIHYIDAYDWVMKPNLEGMGLTSDPDGFATKPYICGSNYLLKMGDYQRGDWCDVVDGLYWRFVHVHRAEFAANPRTALMAKGLDRIAPERRAHIFGQAQNFIDTMTRSA